MNTLIKPPCCNTITHKTPDKPAFAIMTPDKCGHIDAWFIGTDSGDVERSYAFRYFEARKMEAEEDSDLLEVLPGLNLYTYEFASNTPNNVKVLFDKFSTSHMKEATSMGEMTCLNTAVKRYAKLVSACNYLEYCDMP